MKKQIFGLSIALSFFNFTNAQKNLTCQFLTDFFGGTPFISNTDTLIVKLNLNSNYKKDTTTIPDNSLNVLFSSHIVENQNSILSNYNGFIRLYEYTPIMIKDIDSFKPDTIILNRVLTYGAVYDIPNDLTKKELKKIVSEITNSLKSNCNLKFKASYYNSDYRNKKEGKWYYTSKVDKVEIELVMHQFNESDPFTLWLLIEQPID